MGALMDTLIAYKIAAVGFGVMFVYLGFKTHRRFPDKTVTLIKPIKAYQVYYLMGAIAILCSLIVLWGA